MYAITALLAFALAIFLERSWLLCVAWRPNRTHPSGPVEEVLSAGRAETDPEAAWEAMSAASASAESRIRQRVSYLGTVSSLATMIGLLGTVYGLILAFSALGDSSAGERAQRLSEGISTAMATTAYGLLVGIPALAAHAWLQARVAQLLAALESSAGHLVLGLRRS